MSGIKNSSIKGSTYVLNLVISDRDIFISHKKLGDSRILINDLSIIPKISSIIYCLMHKEVKDSLEFNRQGLIEEDTTGDVFPCYYDSINRVRDILIFSEDQIKIDG